MQSVCEEQDASALPDTSFADCHNRLFPLHTKEAAWLSAVSSFVYGTEAGPWADRLKAACHAYGIVDEVKRAIDVLRPTAAEKQASVPVVPHALALNTPSGESHFYPIANHWQIAESSLKMAKDLEDKRFPVAWMRLAARTLCKAAAVAQVEPGRIHPDINRLGEERLPCPASIREAIQKRAALGVPEGAVALYEKAAADFLAGEMDGEQAELFWEMADHHFDILDKTASIDSGFNSGIPQTVFEKEARQVLHLTGEWIPFAALETLPPTLVAGSMNKAAAHCVLQAMACGDGREASKKIASLGPLDQSLLAKLILTHANAA